MRPAPGEWDDLRLAAKAADRTQAAEQLRPAFENRLKELGYGPRAIARAFTSLTGPDSVAAALAELAHSSRLEHRTPVPLAFESVQQEPGLPGGHSLTITGVERDDTRGIQITYEIRPPLSTFRECPRVEARDEHDRGYGDTGAAFVGLAGSEDGLATIGAFTLPFPESSVSLLRVRISWSGDATSVWGRPAYELRIPGLSG